jgi:glycosyltransferase involved in cell wall biosynthesis
MAEALVRVLSDDTLRERLSRAAVTWASRFQWDECGRRSMDALLGVSG